MLRRLGHNVCSLSHENGDRTSTTRCQRSTQALATVLGFQLGSCHVHIERRHIVRDPSNIAIHPISPYCSQLISQLPNITILFSLQRMLRVSRSPAYRNIFTMYRISQYCSRHVEYRNVLSISEYHGIVRTVHQVSLTAGQSILSSVHEI